MFEDILSVEDIENATKEMEQYSVLPNVLATYSNVNLSTEMRDSLLTDTMEILGVTETYDYSEESIGSIIKTMIDTFKQILSTIWTKIIQLVKAIINYFKKDNEIDEMLNGLDEKFDKKFLSKEDDNRVITTLPLANFLIVKDIDKLAHQKYLYIKMTEVRKDILTSVINYITYINNELKRKNIINLNYKCYKDYFMSYVSELYNNDSELSIILNRYKDKLDDEADGFKYIFGYNQNKSYVIKPLDPISMLALVSYNKSVVTIDSNFNKDIIHKHLTVLSDKKGYIVKEEHDIITIFKLLKITKEKLNKKIDQLENEHNILVVQKYIKELTTTIPLMVRSMLTTNSYMYNDYKNNIKKIYKSI